MAKIKEILENILGTSSSELRTENVRKIIIHSTGSRILHKRDHPFLVKFRHKYIRGYSDVGYHALIGNGAWTEDGKIYPGRDKNLVGAHCYGENDDSLGFAFIGNLDEVEPTSAQMDSMIDLIAFTCHKYNLDPQQSVFPHSYFNSEKSCPGKYVDMQKLVEESEIKRGAYSMRKKTNRTAIYSNPRLTPMMKDQDFLN